MLSAKIYDTAAELYGADANNSLIYSTPSVIQIDTIPSGTTCVVKSRVHSSAEWKTEGTYTNSDGVVLLAFAVKRNHVKVERTVGTGAVKAYAQD